MAKDIIQVRKSFVISAVICFLLLLILDWITILTLSINPFLNPDEVVKEIIFKSKNNNDKCAKNLPSC